MRKSDACCVERRQLEKRLSSGLRSPHCCSDLGDNLCSHIQQMAITRHWSPCTYKVRDQTKYLLKSLAFWDSVVPDSLFIYCSYGQQMINTLSPPTYVWLRWSFPIFSITEHIDFATPIQQPAMEPVCNGNLPTSMHTLDHLQGVSNRASLHYTGESQLTEVSVSCIQPVCSFCRRVMMQLIVKAQVARPGFFFCLFQITVV